MFYTCCDGLLSRLVPSRRPTRMQPGPISPNVFRNPVGISFSMPIPPPAISLITLVYLTLSLFCYLETIESIIFNILIYLFFFFRSFLILVFYLYKDIYLIDGDRDIS